MFEPIGPSRCDECSLACLMPTLKLERFGDERRRAGALLLGGQPRPAESRRPRRLRRRRWMQYHAGVLRVVLDTNVLVSAVRSRRGASFALLEHLENDAFGVDVLTPAALLMRLRGLK